MLKPNDLFDLSKSRAKPLLCDAQYPWLALSHLQRFITELGKQLSLDEFDSPVEGVYIAKSAKVSKSALICPPCIIDHGTEVRHCAYIRGGVIIGRNCVIGNSVELKNSIVFDCAQIPHFNYVGDSIIGYRAHLGAGSITSNVKSDKTTVFVKQSSQPPIDTGLRKLGAIVGDYAEIGCNAVLNPGSVICRNSTVYPLCSVRGVIEENRIYKSDTETVAKSI